MKLIGSLTSPYVRKVRVVLAEKKIECEFLIDSPWSPDSGVPNYNPLGKVPVLVLDDSTTLFDSAVIVEYIEGNPDLPLVVGAVVNDQHKPPYDLPANKTRTVFKTLSSPGGGGYNELRIEDRKGQEQIYIHAQKDWDENVEHDQKIRIGHERHDTVEANSYTELKAEEHRTTHKDRKTEVRANDHLTVATNQHVKLGTGQFVEAGNEIHYHAGSKVVIDAGMEVNYFDPRLVKPAVDALDK